jgi:hypothetical protein
MNLSPLIAAIESRPPSALPPAIAAALADARAGAFSPDQLIEVLAWLQLDPAELAALLLDRSPMSKGAPPTEDAPF